MLATAHCKRVLPRRHGSAGRHSHAHCAAVLRGWGLHPWAEAKSAGQSGLPLLTATYKPGTPQHPPLCTFAPPRPLKHDGPIPQRAYCAFPHAYPLRTPPTRTRK